MWGVVTAAWIFDLSRSLPKASKKFLLMDISTNAVSEI